MKNSDQPWRATIRKSLFSLATLLTGLWLVGCQGGSDTTDPTSSDSFTGWPNPTDTGTDSQSSSVTESGSQSTETSSATGSTSTETETETTTATETSTASGSDSLPNGAQCTSNGQCASSHCENNACCDEGECCRLAADCSASLCVSRECTVDSQCVYTPLICGAQDTTDGETCTGNDRCDGTGICATVDNCDNGYQEKPGFVCSPGAVNTACFTSCFNLSQCADGYECSDDGVCVSSIVENGSPCVQDGDCSSGHCESNVCCNENECCTSVSACDQSSCVSRFCDANNECAYYDLQPCGIEDTGDGDTCLGDSACDGFGGCNMVSLCVGPYAPSGGLVCTVGGVAEECRSVCSADTHCNAGYYCNGVACTSKLPSGSGPCSANNQCATDYCTAQTGLCCESGLCCDDDNDCGGFSCDLDEHSCAVTCTNGLEDDNTLCAALGDFHCDSGRCYADVDDGGSCNESSDCDSGYCDAQTFVCCSWGRCCDGEEDCGAFACQESFTCAESCAPSGIDDDALCATGRHCDAGSCIQDLQPGQTGCDEASDCTSENCSVANGVCCSGASPSGTCCSTHSQCDDGNPCTTDLCGGDFLCANTDLEDGSSCDDTSFCNGFEFCIAGECFQPESQCDHLANGCRDPICLEDEKRCTWTVINQGGECSEDMFCLGEPLHCLDGACTFTGTAGYVPCPDLDGNPCTKPACNESSDSCGAEQAVIDYTYCDDGNGCNGADECLTGICTHRGNPCDEDQNACTVDACTDTGNNTYSCALSYPAADGAPCDIGSCWGNAVCSSNVCLPNPTRPCRDGNLCTRESCTQELNGDATCNPAAPLRKFALACNTTTALSDETVFSREAYAWGTTCSSAFGFAGPEAWLTLNLAQPGTVTLQVTSTSPEDIGTTLLAVNDPCNTSSCTATQDGTGVLTRTGLAAGTHNFILEVEERKGLAFTFWAEIAVTCP